jgi:hypothetical protein
VRGRLVSTKVLRAVPCLQLRYPENGIVALIIQNLDRKDHNWDILEYTLTITS